MKKQHSSRKRRTGGALLTVLLLTCSMSAILAVLITASMGRSFMARNLTDRTRALAIAEAGAIETYGRLTTNFDLATDANAFPAKSYGGGTYAIGVSGESSSGVMICSTGYCGQMAADVILDIINLADGSQPEETPWEPAYGYNVCAGGEIRWTGCGIFNGPGKVHANATFLQNGCGQLNADVYSCVSDTCKGNSGFIDGDAYAPAISDSHSIIMGNKIVGPVPQVNIPDINLDPYAAIAAENSQVFTTRKYKISNGDVTPPGGILWVNGDLDISTGGTLTGCFIATGDIQISSQCTQVRVGSLPAFISRDGDIKVTGGADLQGLVYAKNGSIDFSGGGSITGSIVCKGDFDKSGNSQIFAYTDPTPILPEERDPADEMVSVTAWRK